MTAFLLKHQSREGVTDILQHTKPEVFTFWIFTEKVCLTWFAGLHLGGSGHAPGVPRRSPTLGCLWSRESASALPPAPSITHFLSQINK